jgi:YVTN family beta-propeller protein
VTPRAVVSAAVLVAAAALGAGAVVFASSFSTAAAADAGGALWVANERDGSITVIDAATSSVAATLTGVPAPHNVQAGRGATMWATSSGGEVLMLETHYDVHRRVATGEHPAHVVQAPGGEVLVTNEGDDTLAIVDLERLRVAARVPVGRSPHGLRVSPDGRTALVANTGGGTVSAVDLRTRRELYRLAVGREPVQVAFAPGGRFAYVTLRAENAVAKVDLERRRVVARTAVGRGPVQLYPTPDGRLLVVANQGRRAQPGTTVSLVATAPFREVGRVRAGLGPHGVVVDPGGRRAWVTNTYSDDVSVIDLEARAVVATVPTGRAPNGITFTPFEPLRLVAPVAVDGGDGHDH